MLFVGALYLIAMANKSYSEKLKDPRWQKKRLAVLNSSGFRCESCGDTEDTLHVHHVYYEKDVDPWNYPDEAYMVLCDRCHTKWHEMKGYIERCLTHVTVDHLIDLHDIVFLLTWMGPNVTLMFADIIRGYHQRLMTKKEREEELAELRNGGSVDEPF